MLPLKGKCPLAIDKFRTLFRVVMMSCAQLYEPSTKVPSLLLFGHANYSTPKNLVTRITWSSSKNIPPPKP
jgi:hypothetical protein